MTKNIRRMETRSQKFRREHNTPETALDLTKEVHTKTRTRREKPGKRKQEPVKKQKHVREEKAVKTAPSKKIKAAATPKKKKPLPKQIPRSNPARAPSGIPHPGKAENKNVTPRQENLPIYDTCVSQ